MVTRAYLVLLACVVVQRLLELRVSRANEARLRASGAVEHAPEQMPFMIALHTLWLLSIVLELWLRQPPFRLALAVPAIVLFALGQALRLSAMHTLDERWTVKIITLRGAPAVSHGIFRWLRHPNYLGVVLEIAALPLIHGAWISALVFSVANGVLLRVRIRAEEKALRDTGDYQQRLGARPRMLPKLRRRADEHA